MLKQQYQKHFVYSLLLHTMVLLVFVVSFEWSSQMPVVHNSDKPDKVIDAMIMDMPPQPTKMIQKNSPLPKPIAPLEPRPPIKPSAAATKALIIPDNNAKKLQEELIQKQLLADLKKQTNEEKKKQKQKALQTAFEKELKEFKANAQREQMLQEQKRVAAMRSQQMQGVVDKYKALVLQSIGQHWLIPPNVNKKLFAELLIRVAPGGMVLDVQLIKSSGDEGLDRSARAAVFKASPLPVPTESEAFAAFRQFVLKVKPENVLSS